MRKCSLIFVHCFCLQFNILFSFFYLHYSMTKTYLISVSGMGFLAKRTRILPFSANERNVHLWQKLTHVLSFLVKKGFFEGRVNFVTIVPKWKVSGKDQSKNKKVNSWRNWHMSFLFSKKRIFWGGLIL